MNKKLSRRDFLKLAGVTSAGLALSACGVNATELPTATFLSPTGTPLPTETITPTLTSTPIPLEQLPETKQALAEFAQAFETAGVDISSEQLIQKGLEIRTITGKDGNQHDIALAHVENSPLDGDYPLMIKTEGEWEFATPKNLGTMQNKLIGITVAGGEKTSNEPMYGKRAEMFNVIMPPAAFSELYMGQNGNPEKWLKMAKQNNQHLIIESLFGKKVLAGAVADEVYAKERVKAIFQALKNEGITEFSMELALEPFFSGGWDTSNPYYQNLGGKDWIVNAYKIMWDVSQEFGFTPGVDFRVIGITGLVPVKNNNFDRLNLFYLEQSRQIKQKVGSLLNLPESEIPFDLGLEMFIGKPAATIENPIPISAITNREKFKKDVVDFFTDVYNTLGENTKFFVNGFSVNTGDDFGQSAGLTEIAINAVLPYIESLVYFNSMAIDHLGKEPVTYPQFFPNTFFGESPNFNLGAPFFVLNATLMNI